MQNMKPSGLSVIGLVLALSVLGTSGSPFWTTTVNMKGKYSWVLLMDIDNTNNTGILRRQVEIKSYVSGSYYDMKRSIIESSFSTSVESGLGGKVFEVVDVRMRGNMRSEVKSGYERLSESHTSYSQEFSRTDMYEVGPNSKLTLYALHFTGPGISYQTDTISTTPRNLDDIFIDLTVKVTSFLKDIEVYYTQDSVSRPTNIINEARGRNPDINGGFGGEYVWLVPVWTYDPSEAVTGIQVAVQDNGNSNFRDLAKGAGGQFRYLVLQRDRRVQKKISDIFLYRRRGEDGSDTPSSNGWRYASEDINKARGGDYLYLVWN